MTIAALAGPSALVAALATVVGAVFLGLFFWKGGLWGLLNDLASIVLLLATIPVALFLGGADDSWAGIDAPLVTGIGIAGMLGGSASQGLLVARVRTYRQLLPWTLGFGAVVGLWYLLVGAYGVVVGMPLLLAALAAASGAGYIAIGYGFWRGNERHPASVVGGIVLLVASTAFLVWVGIAAIAAEALSR
jgi:hypothetical protein